MTGDMPLLVLAYGCWCSSSLRNDELALDLREPSLMWPLPAPPFRDPGCEGRLEPTMLIFSSSACGWRALELPDWAVVRSSFAS